MKTILIAFMVMAFAFSMTACMDRDDEREDSRTELQDRDDDDNNKQLAKDNEHDDDD